MRRAILLFLLFCSFSVLAQATEEYTGYMGDDVPNDQYRISLNAGQTVTIIAEATSGNLDTYIWIADLNDNILAENDDRAPGDLNSLLVYTAADAGEYVVWVSNIQGTSGNYHLTIAYDAANQSQPSGDFQAQTALQDAQEFTGYMADDVPDDRYPVYLEAGQGIVAIADRTSGDLDTVVVIEDPAGDVVAMNDDRDLNDLNSRAAYVAQTSGEHTVIVSNYEGSSGDYLLQIAIVTAEEAEAISRIELSGAVQYYDTEHFRIHYTLEGDDATTTDYVFAVAQALEDTYALQITTLNWAIPPTDGGRGGNDLYDVYVMDLVNDYDGGDLGFNSPEYPAADNPNTPATEEYAVPSYLVIDNDYNLSNVDDPIQLMRATVAHEYHHGVQFGFDQNESHGWYYEATASWMETITFPQDEDASGYVQNVYSYPEICLGAEGEADPTEGFLMYGSWLFMQSLSDAHTKQVINDLWANIAQLEGWAALEATLAAYDDTIEQAVTRYHLQNLMRDYDLAPAFDGATVWLENTINAPGNWSYTGRGIQELAANYFKLVLPAGLYTVTLNGAPTLHVWAVGIQGESADAFSLGQQGSVDTTPYNEMYLVVINHAYDDDVNACEYISYSLDITAGGEPVNPPIYQLNPRHFTTLQSR
ncbi:MAG: hypothetical protein Kow00117_17970 [Phototrophicales bacterium]